MKLKAEKLIKSINDLEKALQHRKEANKEFVIYAGIAKCFEVCLEYTWKYLKMHIEETGLEAYSPKDIIRTAGRVGVIDDVELWLEFINTRNIAVHDYIGVKPNEYLDLIEKFIKEVKKLETKLAF